MGKSERIAILTDTGSYITPKEAKELGIYLLPLQIIEEKENGKKICYEDLVNIEIKDIYQKINQQSSLKTSLPIYSEIYDVLNDIKANYDSVICIPLTSGISSTSSSIYGVSVELNLPITFIDTFTTCQMQKYIVYEVIQLVKQNKSREEIVNIIKKQLQESNTYILPSDLNHLKRGGRLTPAAALLANILKIYPLLTMNKTTLGKIDVFQKIRTKTKAKKVMIQEILDHTDATNFDIFIHHSDAYQEAEKIKKCLLENGYDEKNIHIDEFSSVISVHVGMQCLAMQYIRKIKE